jgi:hypothetical protein
VNSRSCGMMVHLPLAISSVRIGGCLCKSPFFFLFVPECWWLIHTDNPSTDILDLNSVLLFVAIYVQWYLINRMELMYKVQHRQSWILGCMRSLSRFSVNVRSLRLFSLWLANDDPMLLAPLSWGRCIL